MNDYNLILAYYITYTAIQWPNYEYTGPGTIQQKKGPVQKLTSNEMDSRKST